MKLLFPENIHKSYQRLAQVILLLFTLLGGSGASRANYEFGQNVGSVQCPAYVLMDFETGRVLASRNMLEKRFPASTTKIMTALLAVESGDLQRLVAVGPNPPKVGEQSAFLMNGETFELRDLVEAALIKSANDSCVAIAEGVAGTERKFIEMMNRRAKEIGARQTHFMNPHGLHDPNHYTTAYDLALITRVALKHPTYNEIIATKEARIHGNAKIGDTRLLVNKNKLLFRWNLCDGVKTGYTRQAGRCLVASATHINPQTKRPWRLISVVLHSPDSWTDSHNLLQYGFDSFYPDVMAHGGETLATLGVEGGASTVEAVAMREIRLPLRAGERAGLASNIRSLEPVAPVKKDQPVASLEWRLDGKKIASVPLVARQDVGKSLPAKIAPVAAHVVPSEPWLRWSIYACAALGMTCIFAGWKMRIDERKREFRRQEREAAKRLIG